MEDEAISSVTAITGASPEVARHYLQLTDGNLEQAIQLYFDSPELASMASNTAPAPPPPSSRPVPRTVSRTDSSGVIHIDSDDDAMEEDIDDDDTIQRQAAGSAAPGVPYEDDEAMARRMQQELYSGGDQSGALDGDGVRAPIGRTTETLVGPGADWEGSVDVHDAVLEQLRRRAGPRSGKCRIPTTFAEVILILI